MQHRSFIVTKTNTPGTSALDYLRENLAAGALALPADALEQLDGTI
ncbi:hypothetical protein SAMN05446635_5189 [Burkholderia sp. OK233]|nr:hypothetical protein SAMN05446635_5189 [Burkholderia sp. OK233]